MPDLVRRAHEEEVLAALRQRGALSRAQLAEWLGVSRSTVSEITGELIASGAVMVADTDAATRTGSGRRAQLLRLDARAGQYVGVDLGHRRAHVVVVGAARETLASATAAYDDLDWPGRVRAAVELVDAVAERHDLHYGALLGIGVGVAGTEAELRSRATTVFAERFGCPVVVDNNTRFAALAEAMAEDPASESRDLIFLRLADGVGGGVVTGGRLVAGGRGAAGELGHVRVDRGADAGLCGCGKRGCLETVASVPAVLRAARIAGCRVESAEQLAAAYADGQPGARDAVHRAADVTGQVLGGAALVLSPARIVLGGSLPRLVPDVLTRVAAAVADELASVDGALPDIRGARLDDEDGARGAVLAARDLAGRSRTTGQRRG